MEMREKITIEYTLIANHVLKRKLFEVQAI